MWSAWYCVRGRLNIVIIIVIFVVRNGHKDYFYYYVVARFSHLENSAPSFHTLHQMPPLLRKLPNTIKKSVICSSLECTELCMCFWFSVDVPAIFRRYQPPAWWWTPGRQMWSPPSCASSRSDMEKRLKMLSELEGTSELLETWSVLEMSKSMVLTTTRVTDWPLHHRLGPKA